MVGNAREGKGPKSQSEQCHLSPIDVTKNGDGVCVRLHARHGVSKDVSYHARTCLCLNLSLLRPPCSQQNVCIEGGLLSRDSIVFVVPACYAKAVRISGAISAPA